MQIRWNHVDGIANVIDFDTGAAFEYRAWAFQVRAAVADKAQVGTPGVINLNETEYDACPRFLHGVDQNNTLPPPSFDPAGGGAHVVVTPCVFDVRQDFDPFTTNLRTILWNEVGAQVADTTSPADFWQDIDDGPGGPVSFEIRATGTPCVAVLLTQTCGLVGIQYRPLTAPASGTNLSASGSRAGVILWNPDGAAP
jgi:hypothetical protein